MSKLFLVSRAFARVLQRATRHCKSSLRARLGKGIGALARKMHLSPRDERQREIEVAITPLTSEIRSLNYFVVKFWGASRARGGF